MPVFSRFRYFKPSPEVFRLAVMLCARFPLPLSNLEDILHKAGTDISHETVGFWTKKVRAESCF
jgi:putative transposase